MSAKPGGGNGNSKGNGNGDEKGKEKHYAGNSLIVDSSIPIRTITPSAPAPGATSTARPAAAHPASTLAPSPEPFLPSLRFVQVDNINAGLGKAEVTARLTNLGIGAFTPNPVYFHNRRGAPNNSIVIQFINQGVAEFAAYRINATRLNTRLDVRAYVISEAVARNVLLHPEFWAAQTAARPPIPPIGGAPLMGAARLPAASTAVTPLSAADLSTYAHIDIGAPKAGTPENDSSNASTPRSTTRKPASSATPPIASSTKPAPLLHYENIYVGGTPKSGTPRVMTPEQEHRNINIGAPEAVSSKNSTPSAGRSRATTPRPAGSATRPTASTATTATAGPYRVRFEGIKLTTNKRTVHDAVHLKCRGVKNSDIRFVNSPTPNANTKIAEVDFRSIAEANVAVENFNSGHLLMDGVAVTASFIRPGE